MKFDCPTLFRIREAPIRHNSSTDELLTLWGVQNHTILELFIMLHKMQHYQSMTILKPFGMFLKNHFKSKTMKIFIFFFS